MLSVPHIHSDVTLSLFESLWMSILLILSQQLVPRRDCIVSKYRIAEHVRLPCER